jgi:glycosyltransferase involved in cell wall biosynthesis
MNLAIFSPHEDIGDYTNRNLIYSRWAQKKKINSTLYVGNFNYKTKKKKKLKNFFYEKDNYKNIEIYRIYSSAFKKNGTRRLFSYIIFSFLSLFIFFFIDKKKYHFIVGESVPPIISFAAYLCSIKQNAKFVYQIRDPWPLSIVYSGLMNRKSLIFIFFEAINKYLIKKAKFIISVLPHLKFHYKKTYNYTKRIYYLRNPAEVDDFKPSNYPKIQDKIKVIFAGGFTPSFQILNYFEAIKYIQQNKKDFSFSYYFLGAGLDFNKSYIFAKFNNLKNTYFLKSRSKSEVLNFISDCHLCMAVVSNNKNCKFGYNLNKIIDYTVCGRPIIFTNNLKKNRFVEDYKMGFNTSPLPKEIASKLILFKNLSFLKKKQMGLNARNYANKELNIKKLYIKYCNAFYENNI